MKTRIQKWGNSLALRIPKSFASEVGLECNTPVEISLVDGSLVVKPDVQAAPGLDQLLAQVTEDNLHHEIDTGRAVGDEAW